MAVAVAFDAVNGCGDPVGAVEAAHRGAPAAGLGIAGLAVVDHLDRAEGRRGVIAEDQSWHVQTALGREAVSRRIQRLGLHPVRLHHLGDLVLTCRRRPVKL